MSNQRYDYIILGAGTSGCFLAEKLSRETSLKVLLVDAGDFTKNPFLSIPAGFTQTLFDEKYNWCFRSVSEAQLNNRSIYCPRGRVVGGSSMINGMIHSIGQREDYEDWMGAGFALASPQTIMSAFQELFPEGDGISRSEPHPLESIFLSACEDMGLPKTDKLHEAQSRPSSGVYYHTIKEGQRYGVRGLLPKLKQRKNVSFLTDTHVDKLHFDKDRVQSISVVQKGKKAFDLAVSGEVIICLGAIGSPAVLQRSGIGPKDKLKALNIDVYSDLPSGENLQDHLLVKQTYKLSNIRTYNSDASGAALAKTMWSYSINRKGAMAAGASGAGAFITLNGQSRPDIQIFFAYGSVYETGKSLEADPFDGITIGSCQLRPESRGSVTISSTHPLAAPHIHYNYLATENDWHAAREGLNIQNNIMAQAAFAPFKPQAKVDKLEGDDFIREHAETAHHPSGTCASGPKGVVDGDLRVYGLHNLRIADASVFPQIISGNTQAICAVIGNLLGHQLLLRR